MELRFTVQVAKMEHAKYRGRFNETWKRWWWWEDGIFGLVSSVGATTPYGLDDHRSDQRFLSALRGHRVSRSSFSTTTITETHR